MRLPVSRGWLDPACGCGCLGLLWRSGAGGEKERERKDDERRMPLKMHGACPPRQCCELTEAGG